MTGPMSTVVAAVGRADLHLLARLAEPLDQRIGDVADRHGDAAGHAALAGAAEGRELQGARRPGRGRRRA